MRSLRGMGFVLCLATLASAEQKAIYPLQILAYQQGMADLTQARDKSYQGENAVLHPPEMKETLTKLRLLLEDMWSHAPEEYRIPDPVKEDFFKHVEWLKRYPYSVQEAVTVVHETEEIRSRLVVLYVSKQDEELSKKLLELGAVIDKLQSHTMHLAFSADMDSILQNLPDAGSRDRLLKAMDTAAAQARTSTP